DRTTWTSLNAPYRCSTMRFERSEPGWRRLQECETAVSAGVLTTASPAQGHCDGRPQGCVTPANITRSANVKSPASAEGNEGANAVGAFRYEPASLLRIRANVFATIFPPTGPRASLTPSTAASRSM